MLGVRAGGGNAAGVSGRVSLCAALSGRIVACTDLMPLVSHVSMPRSNAFYVYAVCV